MDNKLKFQQLECYKLATDEQKEKLNKEQYFDLDNCRETSFRQNLSNTFTTVERRYPS